MAGGWNIRGADRFVAGRVGNDVQTHGQVLRRCHLSGRADMSLAIQLEHVTKRYRAGRSRTLVDMLAQSVSGWRGKSSEVHSATRGSIGSTIAALDDVSFDVHQ